MTLTAQNLDEMTLAQLVALHNEHADTPVKKFATKAKAIERVLAVLPAEEPEPKKAMPLSQVMKKTAAKDAKKAQEREANAKDEPTPAKKDEPAAPAVPEEWAGKTIKVVAAECPHKSGTDAAYKWDQVAAADGMGIEEFVAGCTTNASESKIPNPVGHIRYLLGIKKPTIVLK
jgi:hypothetical protein